MGVIDGAGRIAELARIVGLYDMYVGRAVDEVVRCTNRGLDAGSGPRSSDGRQGVKERISAHPMRPPALPVG